MTDSLMKRLGAETIGTFGLVFFGTGAMATIGPSGGTPGHIVISLAFGLALMTMIFALGPISGAHFNPAVTFGLVVARRFPLANMIPYWIAQVLGAALATLAVKALVSGAENVHFGANIVGEGINMNTVFMAEVILTFVLAFVVMGVATNPSVAPSVPGMAIGFTVVICALAFGPVSGASMNPARSIGPALFAGTEAIKHLWLFIVAPLLGGALAGLIYEAIRTES